MTCLSTAHVYTCMYMYMYPSSEPRRQGALHYQMFSVRNAAQPAPSLPKPRRANPSFDLTLIPFPKRMLLLPSVFRAPVNTLAHVFAPEMVVTQAMEAYGSIHQYKLKAHDLTASSQSDHHLHTTLPTCFSLSFFPRSSQRHWPSLIANA